MIFELGQLFITLNGMNTHGCENEKYAQYLNELWPNDPNFTIGSFLGLLQLLEVVPISKSKLLFEHPPQNSFFARLLQGKSCYVCELWTPD
jgi:hypothetical protein